VALAQAGAAPQVAGGAGSAAAPAVEGGQRPQLNDSEQFAKRVGEEEPDRARAVTMRNLSSIAPQGTIIPGVLETAINSDLPGFTRAIVSRDVLSFDGRAVLIPRSSRLIGQYKSAVALGQSRAFIIWTRIIRPDGVSIQIGSPGTDELGRGGLDGEVNRHFFRRFSGSILLSVLNAGVASVGSTPSTQITIGSPGAATGLVSSALQGDAIPPTIKVAQGEAINIFVARDLDFSGVEPIR
jgi:type IV secretory pathway VirB10-like protein